MADTDVPRAAAHASETPLRFVPETTSCFTCLLLTLWTRSLSLVHTRSSPTADASQQNAKVTIKISDRNKMDPHTHEREVSITGTYAAIQLACAMISEKLSQNKPRMSYASDTHDDEGYDENGGQGGYM